jgi:hypothetical protein
MPSNASTAGPGVNTTIAPAAANRIADSIACPFR